MRSPGNAVIARVPQERAAGRIEQHTIGTIGDTRSSEAGFGIIDDDPRHGKTGAFEMSR